MLLPANAWTKQSPGRQVGYEPISVLLQAVAERRIGLTILLDHRAVRTPRDITSKIPRVVLISDDTESSRGPDEWRCSISSIAWSRTAIVHGTGALVSHYQTAVISAEATGRLLFVETNSFHAPAWAAAIAPRQAPCLVIVPPAGGVHPAEVGAQ
jgi:hypothetical protein